MGRIVKDWKPIKADEIEIAPHRYLWTGAIGADGQPIGDIALADSYAEAKACVPYKVGEVIYIERSGQAVRALIYSTSWDRNWFSERREFYNVQPETKDGTFSKLWERVYPGFIQRGYQRAGLAPEMPEERS